jgi:hypothetical protein
MINVVISVILLLTVKVRGDEVHTQPEQIHLSYGGEAHYENF